MFNRFITWLARSPLHNLISKSILVIRYEGRRSGNPYAVPVNYVETEHEGGRRIWVTSARERSWWRNFTGGHEALLVLRGKSMPAELFALTDEQDVAQGLSKYLGVSPRAARYFGVALDEAGRPVDSDVARAAAERVMVFADL